jgi:hypothetical protein
MAEKVFHCFASWARAVEVPLGELQQSPLFAAMFEAVPYAHKQKCGRARSRTPRAARHVARCAARGTCCTMPSTRWTRWCAARATCSCRCAAVALDGWMANALMLSQTYGALVDAVIPKVLGLGPTFGAVAACVIAVMRARAPTSAQTKLWRRVTPTRPSG